MTFWVICFEFKIYVQIGLSEEDILTIAIKKPN